jgi:hypothetical protein
LNGWLASQAVNGKKKLGSEKKDKQRKKGWLTGVIFLPFLLPLGKCVTLAANMPPGSNDANLFTLFVCGTEGIN